MVKHKHTIEELLNDTCGTCQKGFKTTQGLGAHQTMSKKCSWYKKGKLREMFTMNDEGLDDNVMVESSGQAN